MSIDSERRHFRSSSPAAIGRLRAAAAAPAGGTWRAGSRLRTRQPVPLPRRLIVAGSHRHSCLRRVRPKDVTDGAPGAGSAGGSTPTGGPPVRRRRRWGGSCLSCAPSHSRDRPSTRRRCCSRRGPGHTTEPDLTTIGRRLTGCTCEQQASNFPCRSPEIQWIED